MCSSTLGATRLPRSKAGWRTCTETAISSGDDDLHFFDDACTSACPALGTLPSGLDDGSFLIEGPHVDVGSVQSLLGSRGSLP